MTLKDDLLNINLFNYTMLSSSTLWDPVPW